MAEMDTSRKMLDVRKAVFPYNKDHWMTRQCGSDQFHEWLGPIRQNCDYDYHVDDYHDKYDHQIETTDEYITN